MDPFMNRLYIIFVIIKYHPSVNSQGKEGVINQCSSVYYLSFRNSLIPFKNVPINCPLLVTKMLSINDDAHSLSILASLLSVKNIALHLTISGAL